MKTVLVSFLFSLIAVASLAQNSGDTSIQSGIAKKADDPSQFITRMEVYNELQYYKKRDIYLNQTILRSVIKIGKKFTTRIDLPLVHNSFSPAGDMKSTGIGDISFRMLGYKFREKPLSAFTASMEISLNTAASRLLGTGKTILIRVVSYTQAFPKDKLLFSLVLQQANSIGGDENRADINFSKIQLIGLRILSKKTWFVLAPEWFIDYEQGGVSMNLRSRLTHAPKPRLNLWITPSAGIFGDFPGRYHWSIDIGSRYFLFK
jgi:hypothetical protein